MIVLHTRKDVEESALPFFVTNTANFILDTYETENLEGYGGVHWIEDEKELATYRDKIIEYSEIIITEDGKVWHGAFISNNEYSVDVYVQDSLLPSDMRKEWQNNLIRTVDENEFQQ